MSKKNATVTEIAPPAATPAIALDKPRVIRILVGSTPVDFTIARIPDAGWRKCLEAIITRVEQVMIYPDGEDAPGVETKTRIIEEDAALVALFQYVLQVKGYAGTEGLGDSAIKARVPMRHRLAVGQVLRACHATTPGEATLSELVEVTLSAPWTIGADGGMEEIHGLIHRFRQPTLEQYRRWRLGLARITTTGDAQNGVTTYPSRLAVALGLYDEMIAEVEGYTFNGDPITRLEDIKSHMDGMHKARAVVELFERGDEDLSIAGPPVAKPVADAVAAGTETPETADAAA